MDRTNSLGWRSWEEYVRDRGGMTSLEVEKGIDRPLIVTLCGSTRFVPIFNQFRKAFTLKGLIVLSIEVVTTQQEWEDPQRVNPEVKAMLDLLHLEKIKMSDCIFVINKDGYIGDSTRREIDYANYLGIPIDYLENPYEADLRQRTSRGR